MRVAACEKYDECGPIYAQIAPSPPRIRRSRHLRSQAVPVYEFQCERCGERFDALVDPGTQSTPCRACGHPDTRRVFSAPAAPMRLVKSRGETRKQERRNAQLRERTKARFKEARRRARARREGGGGGA